MFRRILHATAVLCAIISLATPTPVSYAQGLRTAAATPRAEDRIRAVLDKNGAKPSIDCRMICGSRFCCVERGSSVRVPACLFDNADMPAVKTLEARAGAKDIVQRCNAIAGRTVAQIVGPNIRIQSAASENPMTTVAKAGLDANRCGYCCWSAPGAKSIAACGSCCNVR